jgi:hypothetical protein
MRTDSEITRYQKTLAQYRDNAKAMIASAQPNSAVYTEAIKVFLRCDGASVALIWVLEVGVGDFRVTPTFSQRDKG